MDNDSLKDQNDLRRKAAEDEEDTEGHSMFLYEAARNLNRDHEREARETARQQKLERESKQQQKR